MNWRSGWPRTGYWPNPKIGIGSHPGHTSEFGLSRGWDGGNREPILGRSGRRGGCGGITMRMCRSLSPLSYILWLLAYGEFAADRLTEMSLEVTNEFWAQNSWILCVGCYYSAPAATVVIYISTGMKVTLSKLLSHVELEFPWWGLLIQLRIEKYDISSADCPMKLIVN